LKGETSTRKIAFNTAAHAIGVTAAYGAVVACGLAPGIGVIANSPAGWARQLAALVVAAIAYSIVDETLAPTAIVLATGLSWRTVVGHDADIRSTVRLANLVSAGAAVALLDYRRDLVLVLPLAILTIYLAASQRLRLPPHP